MKIYDKNFSYIILSARVLDKPHYAQLQRKHSLIQKKKKGTRVRKVVQIATANNHHTGVSSSYYHKNRV